MHESMTSHKIKTWGQGGQAWWGGAKLPPLATGLSMGQRVEWVTFLDGSTHVGHVS